MLHMKPWVAQSVMQDYWRAWVPSEDGKKYQAMRTQLWRKLAQQKPVQTILAVGPVGWSCKFWTNWPV